MTTDTEKAVRESLVGVTPGPWEVYSEKVADKNAAISESAYQVEHTEPFVGEIFMLNGAGKCPAMTGCGPCSEANARYIAAVNPEAITALLSELDAARAERDRLRVALEPFGTVGAVIDGPFGPALFAENDMAFQSGCAWSENGERKTLTWGDFRRARSALSSPALESTHGK